MRIWLNGVGCHHFQMRNMKEYGLMRILLFSMLDLFRNVEIKKKYGPEIVRHSDIFYKFIVSSEKELLALKEEIKEEILDRLKD